MSHYYKFLTLQSQLAGYDQAYIDAGKQGKNNVAPEPAAPPVPKAQFTPDDLSNVVYNCPSNPTSSQFGEGRKELVDIADALFQYMLVMTETIYKVPAQKQKIYFYRSMHQSMIWVMDKFFQSLREITTEDGKTNLCPTFANIDLGSQVDAFSNLTTMVTNFLKVYGSEDWYANAEVHYYLKPILDLPDVTVFWQENPSTQNPYYLQTPDTLQGIGTNPDTPTPATSKFYTGIYAGVPQMAFTSPNI